MDLYLSFLIFFVIFITLSIFIIFYKHNHPITSLNLPPGTIGYPIIGESLEFLSTGWKGYPEKFIFDRINKYSSNVFKTSLLGEPFAIFAGAACNKFLFTNENNLVNVWWPSSVDKVFPSSTQTSSKEEGVKMRKMLPTILKPEALKRYISTMDSITQQHFESYWENKDEVLVFPLAKRYTFWLACRLLINVEDPNYIAKLAEPFNLIASGLISMPIDLPGTPFNKAIKASNFIRKELHEIIKQRKVDLAKGMAPTQDILSHMLVTCDEKEEYMKDFDIADKVIGLLIGGHDTTSSACTFVVKFLAELPHIYDAVYKEQMEIANSKSKGELLNWEDIGKMSYSWAVACEVMRLSPPFQGAFREAIHDFTFNGFFIPKGWKLYWSSNLTHKNSECFPKSEKFDPARFDGTGPAPYTYVPFGGGPRMCPGQEYARLEILVFMHNLVKRFKLEKLVPDEEIRVDPMPIPVKGLPIHLIAHKF